MHVHHTMLEMIQAWSCPKDKLGVKLFLQTVQFGKVFMRMDQTVQFYQVFMRPDQNAGLQTYSHLTLHTQKHKI